ncbi:MAG: glycosyltransferase [bacterium]
MNYQKPLVSVIVATHGDRADYLKKAIESIFSQTYKNIEIIIIDDNSTDKTKKVVQFYLKNPKVHYIYQKENKGPSETRNNGIKTAGGKYVAILDSDDFWFNPKKIEKQVNFLEKNSEYVLVGGGVIRINKKGQETKRFFLPKTDKDIRNSIIFNNNFVHSTTLFRKSAWQKAGGYDKRFDFCEDWDLWLKFGKFGKFYNFQEYFIYYLEGGESQSDYNFRRSLKFNIELRKKYRNNYPGKRKAVFLNLGYHIFIFLPFKRSLHSMLSVIKSRRSQIKICYVASVDITFKFILLNHLKFLKKEGYDVFAVCSSGKWLKDIENEGIKIKTIEIKRKISPIFDIIAFLKLYFYFKKEKFDIVHTHTPKPGFLGQIAAKLAGIPIIFHTSHGFYFQKNSPHLKRKFFIFFEKVAAKCSDIIFFVNKEDMKTALNEKICKKEKIRYFGGGVDINRFSPDLFSKEFVSNEKKKLGINPERKIIGIVARLVKEKGYLDLFKAFKQVLASFPDTVLLIVGPEEPQKRDAIDPDIIKKYNIEKNVLFLGEMASIDRIYPLMNIFVLPSHREGLGISLLEAQAMEKPVVATDIRGCREAVDNGKTGILVPPKNPQKLAEAIIYLLSNLEEMEEMGKKGKEKIVKEFDEKIVFDRIINEYQRLIYKKLK